MTRKGIKLRVRRYTFSGFIQLAPWLWPKWYSWFEGAQ